MQHLHPTVFLRIPFQLVIIPRLRTRIDVTLSHILPFLLLSLLLITLLYVFQGIRPLEKFEKYHVLLPHFLNRISNTIFYYYRCSSRSWCSSQYPQYIHPSRHCRNLRECSSWEQCTVTVTISDKLLKCCARCRSWCILIYSWNKYLR